MMEEIDHQYLLSLGFTKAAIRDSEDTLKQLRAVNSQVEIQLLKADLVAGPEHLYFAARNALYSFRGKRRRSKSLAVELLLYISCQRQISKAIKFLGVDPTDRRIVLVALSKSKDALAELARRAPLLVGGELDDNLVEIGSDIKLAKIQRSYGVTGGEIEAAGFQGETDMSVLKRLIVERSALLDIQD